MADPVVAAPPPASRLVLPHGLRLYLSTPTTRLSLLLLLAHYPTFLAIYRALKAIRRTYLRHGSELNSILRQMAADAKDRTAGGGRRKVERLCRLDLAMHRSRALSAELRSLVDERPEDERAYSEALLDLALQKRIDPSSQEYVILQDALARLQAASSAGRELLHRCTLKVTQEERAVKEQLAELWTLLRPTEELLAGPTKQWQSLGFQGGDPSTDFRATGRLGLDSIVYFALTQPELARHTVQEAVSGGEGYGWYPFAIAYIAVVDFIIGLLRERRLRVPLIQAYSRSTAHASSSAQNSDATTADADDRDPFADPSDAASVLSSQTSPTLAESSSAVQLQDVSVPVTALTDEVGRAAFFELIAKVALLFHEHWKIPPKGEAARHVMMFEQVFASFKTHMAGWIERNHVPLS